MRPRRGWWQELNPWVGGALILGATLVAVAAFVLAFLRMLSVI